MKCWFIVTFLSFFIAFAYSGNIKNYIFPDNQKAFFEIVNNENALIIDIIDEIFHNLNLVKDSNFLYSKSFIQWLTKTENKVFSEKIQLKNLLILLFFIFLIVSIILLYIKHKFEIIKHIEQIQNDEAFKKRIFDSSCIPVVIMDADNYKYIDCNQATVAIYNFKSISDTIGKTPFDVSASYQYDGSKSEDKALYYINLCKEKGTITFEWLHQRENGEKWDAEVHLLYFSMNNRCYFQFSLIDITSEKEAKKLLEEIILKNPMSIQIVDSEGYTISVNPAHTELFRALPPADYSVFNDFQLNQQGLADYFEQVKKGKEITFPDFCYNAHEVNPDFPDHPVWVRMITFPLYDNRKNISRFVLMHTDITKRKQAEIKLFESERMFRTIFNQSPVSIILYNHLNGDVIDANQAALDIYGFDSIEQLKKNDFWLDSPYSMKDALDWLQKTVKYGSQEFEWCSTNQKKKIVWEQVKTVPVNFSGIDRVLVIGVNITYQKKAVSDLIERQRMFSTLIENLPGFAYRCDNDNNWTMSFISSGCYEVTGYKSDDFLKSQMVNFNNIIHPEYQQYLWNKWQICINNKIPLEEEYRIIKASGDIAWIWERGRGVFDNQDRLLYLEGFITDITKMKKNEEELLIFKESLDRSLEAVCISDTYGEIYYSNKTFDELFGDKNIRHLSRFCNKDFASEIYTLLKNGQNWVGELKMYDKSDKVLDILLKTYAVVNKHQEITSLVFIHNDITKQKLAETEGDKLKNRLNHAQKMESIGRLAGGIAHDFNNMLGVILGYTDIILMKINSIHPFYSKLSEIRKAAEHSSNLTRQLLAFAKKQSIQPVLTNLSQIIENSLSMLKSLIGENINLVWLPSDKEVLVRVDISQIEQVLTNLCINAKDAVIESGLITIETGVAIIHEGKYATLSVSDNGVGMDKDTRSKLFEPFFTTKEYAQATGLGLSTVYGIVSQNNGFITVESDPGAGSVFIIYLPLEKSVSKEKIVINDEFIENAGILLIEDEPTLLKMAQDMLELAGFRVISTKSPLNALSIFKKSSSEIKLIISDVIMPEMNGKDLCEKILEYSSDIRILFMSGYTADVISQHSILEDSINFIQKPFKFEELITKVKSVLSE